MDAVDLLSDLKLYGGKGHDELFGGKGSDELDGGEDNDTLLGRSGNDILKGGLGNDVLNGGGGIDTIVFGDLNSHIRLGPSFHKQFQDTGHGLDTIYTKNIENVITGSGNDIVKGQSLNNVIDTGSGNDFIKGGGGDDIIKAGLGDDTIHGGKGIDTIVFDDLDTTINLGWWWNKRSQDTGHGLDTIYTKNIENVITGSGHDFVKGQSFNNVLDAGSGNDEVLGRGGDDTNWWIRQ